MRLFSYHIPSSTITFSLIISIILIITTINPINAQRDLVAIDQKRLYLVDVSDKNGKQIIMGGVDPRSARPDHPTMCYTTPWNHVRGNSVVDEATDRLHYVAPAWYQLHLDIVKNENNKNSLNVKITGHDNINNTILHNIWHKYIGRTYAPKVTPRLSVQITPNSIKILLNPKTHVSIIESILELVHVGGLPRVNSYKGYDGIVLEMPSIWANLPPYPSEIVSFIDPIEYENMPKKDKRVPVDPNRDNSDFEGEDQLAKNYGTFHYDFTASSLVKHPRHIINQFVRKLGVALQAGGKSLLIVTAPYQYQQDKTQHFQPNKQQQEAARMGGTTKARETSDVYEGDSLFKRFDSLECQKGNDIVFPRAFSHIDAYYLAPYIDYNNVMTYDFEPELLNDVHHIRDLEKQTRTVATTRIGYNGKRIWRIFNGKSTVSETMFLEDYIRMTEELNEVDLDNIGKGGDGQSDDRNDNKKDDENDTPLTEDEKTHQLAVMARARELEIQTQLQFEIDKREAKLRDDVHLNILQRSHPRRDELMCFNPFFDRMFNHFNDVSAQCTDEMEPGQWWNSRDYWKHSRNISVSFGVDNELPEEESTEGVYKRFSADTMDELIDSITIHKLKLMKEFSLKKDDPWPKNISYGWSVSPATWMKNAIFATNIPSMCLAKMMSHWDSLQVSNVPIQYAVDLKKTLPKTTILRDLVIPIKLDRIKAQFNKQFDNVDHLVELRNNTISELCAQRQELILNLTNDNKSDEIPIDVELDNACIQQRELIETDNDIKSKNKLKSKKNNVQNSKHNKINDDGTVNDADHINNDDDIDVLPEQQLDWSFPTMELDQHIQNRIDKDPKFNVIRVFAGMNWYGYMYIGRDLLEEKKNHDNDDDNNNNGNVEPVKPIAMTSQQVEREILQYKGQIDIKHDLASGDRFIVMRDGPGNNDVRTIWYPSYRQLHRKLHNIRSIADGIAIWECGQGTEGFEQLI